MEIIQSIHLLRSRLAELKQSSAAALKNISVGFVPTMGYLHKGHMSLVQAAREQCGIVVLSIFVNPLQFGPNEDFERYPRDTERDLKMAEDAGVDVVFLPQVEEMYPRRTKTTVLVSGVTSRLCGASRPGHFEGVATVVTKLFNIVKPDKAFFGLKDAQQVAVIQQMAADLNMDVEIVPCPILREADGLAMSSRNVYLQPEERRQALVLSQALRKASQWVAAHPTFSVNALQNLVTDHIRTAPLGTIDYVEVLSYPSLEPVREVPSPDADKIIIAVAVKFSKTRLIDNIIIPVGV